MEILLNYNYREDQIPALIDIESLARFVIESEGKPENTEVSVSFVTDDEMHELNRMWRGIDRPTDVLSFECDNLDDDFDASYVADVYELGDIVIAPDVAERQSQEFGLTFPEELSLLIVHGLLHLCGYDHMSDDEAQVMEAREGELLSAFWKRPFNRSVAEAERT